jgi:hypothetical protein
MSRSAYWTILIGTSPTAFRAREAAELQPTLVQLRRTQPDAVMKWFERGRVWASPEEAMDARRAERQASRTRSRDWRPGGTHVDVRLAYKRAKQSKWDRVRGKHRPRLDESDRSAAERPGRAPRGPRQDGSTRPPAAREARGPNKAAGARGPRGASGLKGPRRESREPRDGDRPRAPKGPRVLKGPRGLGPRGLKGPRGPKGPKGR